MKNIFCLLMVVAVFSLAGAKTLTVSSRFDKNAEGWNTPRYWNGKLTWQKGKMQLLPSVKNGKTFGRCTKMILPLRHLSGSLLTLTFDASGKGQVTVGAMVFPESPAKPYMVEAGKVTLSPAEKKFEVQLDLSKVQTDRISLTFEIPAGAELVFDNVSLARKADHTIRIDQPEIPVMRQQAADIAVKTNRPGKEFSVFCGSRYFAVKADSLGRVIIPKEKISLSKVDASVNITVACGGKSRISISSRTSLQVYQL